MFFSFCLQSTIFIVLNNGLIFVFSEKTVSFFLTLRFPWFFIKS